jgi:uncharacterized protein (TIGR02246 family)
MSGAIEVTRDDAEMVRQAIWSFSAAWNMHSPKYMAAGWLEDGDLIGPYGRLAVGRPAVEELFSAEQASVFAKTRYTVSNVRRVFHVASRDVAVASYDAVINKMRSPDGSPWDPLVHTCTVVVARTEGRWMVASARPTVVATLPPWAPPWFAGIGDTPPAGIGSHQTLGVRPK